MKKPTDAVALLKFVQDNLERGDWQGRASAEVAYMAPDFDVPWPIDGTAGKFDAMIVYALAAIDATRGPSATMESVFLAGRSVERVLSEWTKKIVARNGKPNTDHFYAIADNLVRQGVSPTKAYKKAEVWCRKNGKEIPDRSAFKRHRAKQRG